jgi:hypothetical protein
MACLAANRAHAVGTRYYVRGAPSPSQAKRALKCNLAMCCASNRPVGAVTASRFRMRQTWRRLTFLHWPFAPDLIRPHIPPGLQLDTFENAAWIGLVPFEIYGTPGLPYFPETNLRTYVVGPMASPRSGSFRWKRRGSPRFLAHASVITCPISGRACASTPRAAPFTTEAAIGLVRASVRELRETLFESAGIPSPIGPPLAHYAGNVSVKIGRLELH